MLRALEVQREGTWSGVAVDTVVLTYDDRYRRRIVMNCVGGMKFMLDLEKPTVLADGDALVLSDGQRVSVVAAPEPLIEITCEDASHLARIAWHIGNRHLPADINSHRILIRSDHVIAEMLIGLGALIKHINAPFNPERGAYDNDEGHAHAHDHGDHHHG